MNPLIKLTDIEAGYDDQLILRNVNLEVHAGDFVGVIGPNGGGKTTLLRIMLGLIQPLKGTVTYPGLTNGIKSIGYLPQSNLLDARFPIRVTDVVLSGLTGSRPFFGRISKADKQKADELLDMVGLKTYANQLLGELSGGQKQRALLCRAIINDPQLLFLDEPNTYVDKTFEGELYQLLADMNKHMAIVLVSHDIGTISSVVKTLACVNGSLHYHSSNKVTDDLLKIYNCPVELITHGTVPHRVLKQHS